MRKRLLCALALCAALLIPAAVPAGAEWAGASGFYGIGASARAEIIPLSEAGAPAAAIAKNVDGIEGDEVFYPGSCALRVILRGTAAEKQYLLTLSAGETLLFADQQNGGGSMSFRVAFQLPKERTALLLQIGSDADGFEAISVPLFYLPATGGFADCPRGSGCVMAPFSDLDPAAWYHDGVHYALETGIMNGVGEGRFSPGSPASRAMIVTMLWRMEGEPLVGDAARFEDVPAGAWYSDAVRWAASAGIAGGYSPQRFGPNDNVSREQLATILWRYAAYKGEDTGLGGIRDLGAFIDAERISDWAVPAMQWAVAAQLISGVGGERLSPETDASRAQVATLLMRFAAKA